MTSPVPFLSPSEAAARLGISTKALRLYEQRGLIRPSRTAAGWRAYGPADMARAADIAALRALGFSLAQVARALTGDDLEPALALHQGILEGRSRDLAALVAKVRQLRADLSRDDASVPGIRVAFDLPWPWGGERFELSDIRALTYIIGPLGSGKTRLARRLAETLPGAAFVDIDRLEDDGAAARARMAADPALPSRVVQAAAQLADDGATASAALIALLVALESEGPAVLVVDMVEQGLDRASQRALIAHLRRRGPRARPLFLMTRSNAILDLAEVGPDETIILCPANHSPPTSVAPCPGAPSYEAVATCLASPEVRARTEGVIAWRPQVA